MHPHGVSTPFYYCRHSARGRRCHGDRKVSTVIRQRNDRKWNPEPLDRESDAVTIRLVSHPDVYTTVYGAFTQPSNRHKTTTTTPQIHSHSTINGDYNWTQAYNDSINDQLVSAFPRLSLLTAKFHEIIILWSKCPCDIGFLSPCRCGAGNFRTHYGVKFLKIWSGERRRPRSDPLYWPGGGTVPSY